MKENIIERNFKEIDKISRSIFYRYKLKSVIEIDDFIQETSIECLKQVKNYNDSYKFTTFIYKVCSTKAKEIIRTAHGTSKSYDKLDIRMNTISIDYQYNKEDGEIDVQISDEKDFKKDLFVRLEVERIFQNINVREIDKKVMILYMRGMSYREISQFLDIPTSSVSSIFVRLRKIFNKKSFKN